MDSLHQKQRWFESNLAHYSKGIFIGHPMSIMKVGENDFQERRSLMGKVWLKTKYDSGMQMEIPHSVNMATAMYGFRELGAEIIP